MNRTNSTTLSISRYIYPPHPSNNISPVILYLHGRTFLRYLITMSNTRYIHHIFFLVRKAIQCFPCTESHSVLTFGETAFLYTEATIIIIACKPQRCSHSVLTFGETAFLYTEATIIIIACKPQRCSHSVLTFGETAFACTEATIIIIACKPQRCIV